MSDCNHDCESCSANCSSRTQEQTDFLEPLYRESSVKKVIGVVSGKGGVGKSMTTSLLAVAAMRKGLHTAILDADVTGPSIPQVFGLHERLLGNAEGIIMPALTNFGIEVVSLNDAGRRDSASYLERTCRFRCGKTVLGQGFMEGH